tara:strand:+ start:630 stop:1091 length:462 start_codon:yes stop_codon:yes gene_type:complete
MVNKRTVVDGNLDGTGGKKETMQQKLRDNISGGPALSTAKGVGRAANKLSEKAQEELRRIKEAQAKKNSTETPVTNVDTETLKREDPVARMRRATGKTGMKKGGMAKKGYAMGGMMKKGYSKGGAMKKKGAKKGGKVRGVGIARKGFRPAKMR